MLTKQSWFEFYKSEARSPPSMGLLICRALIDDCGRCRRPSSYYYTAALRDALWCKCTWYIKLLLLTPAHARSLALSCTCLLATINFWASEVARRGLLLPHSLALRELETYSLSFYWRERVVIVWRSHSQHARLTRLVIAAGFIFVRCQGDFLLWFTEPSYWELWRKMNWITL